ncbi:MAG: hypothetical protein GY862_34015, partial [Gammaproteobacteria bacterium]|nr:hypothetical protein [Gammaproteobacteria bacterium]
MQEDNYSRLMKSIASIVLVAFIMFILEPAAKAAQVLLHQEYEQGRAAEAREQAKRLAGTLESVEAALLRLQTKLSAKVRQRSADPGLAELVREALPPFRGQLNALDEQVLMDFDAVEAHLRGKNLPPEIIRRHREAVAAYDRDMQTLQGNLDNVAGIAEKTPQN